MPEDLKLENPRCIKQGYLAIDKNGNEVRVRKIDSKFFLTVKSSGTLVRNESEVEITHEVFTQFWKFVGGRFLSKKRYDIFYYEHKLEVDIYENELEGLITLELEFDNINKAINFVAPSWFGKDVTNDSKYKNKYLSTIKNFKTF